MTRALRMCDSWCFVRNLTLLRSCTSFCRTPTTQLVLRGYGEWMSHNKRKGEPPEPHSRSDRVVMARGRWYVTTRERVDVGPYETKEEAEIAANHLAKALDGVDEPAVAVA